MRILLIEDDLTVARFILDGIKQAGHHGVHAPNGKKGLAIALEKKFHVMIIDRMLPMLDGLSLIKTLRASHNDTPILILSALGDVDDRVLGLRSGGDDYLVKPFALEELIARIEIMSRRQRQDVNLSNSLSAGDLVLDLISRKVFRQGREIELKTREFKLLEFILRHKGQVVTRTMLLEQVWDYHFDPQTNIIDVHVSRLRTKIDKDFDIPIIRTIRGAGYIIEA